MIAPVDALIAKRPPALSVERIVQDGVRIGIEAGHCSHRRSVGGVFHDRIAGKRGALRRLRDIDDCDGERLVKDMPALVRRPHRDLVRSRALVIQQQAVGDGDDTGRGVDREAAAGAVDQRIAQDSH